MKSSLKKSLNLKNWHQMIKKSKNLLPQLLQVSKKYGQHKPHIL